MGRGSAAKRAVAPKQRAKAPVKAGSAKPSAVGLPRQCRQHDRTESASHVAQQLPSRHRRTTKATAMMPHRGIGILPVCNGIGLRPVFVRTHHRLEACATFFRPMVTAQSKTPWR